MKRTAAGSLPHVTGEAYVTGESTLIFDDADPLRWGIDAPRVSKHVLIVGGGIVGFSVAYYCARKGTSVTLIERGGPDRGGCSFVNAGMLVPSHIVPLASPGMVRLGLRWMWNPESPFYVKPRLSADLLLGLKFHRASDAGPRRPRAHRCFGIFILPAASAIREWASLWNNEFDLVERGMLTLCNTERGLEEEARARRVRARGARHCRRVCCRRRRRPSSSRSST